MNDFWATVLYALGLAIVVSLMIALVFAWITRND